MAAPGGPRPRNAPPPNYNPNALADSMQNLQVNRPNQPPSAPRPNTPFGQQPPFSGGPPVSRPGPPPPGVFQRGPAPPSGPPHTGLPPPVAQSVPPFASRPPPPGVMPSSMGGAPPPPGSLPSALGPRPGPPGPFSSSPLTTGPAVPPPSSISSSISNGPPAGGPGMMQGGGRFPPSSNAMRPPFGAPPPAMVSPGASSQPSGMRSPFGSSSSVSATPVTAQPPPPFSGSFQNMPPPSGSSPFAAPLLVFQSFGQHGRELITTELALRILSILSEEEFLSSAYPLNLNNTLDRLVIKVVPMENVNGRKLVEAGDLCERRNGRGVDLNRNWSVDWGKKEKDYDPYEENPGSAPFSEPETQIMRKICASFEPHVWVNVHSGMEALFMPYDHKNTTPEGLPSQRMRLMLEKLNRFQLNDRCLVGSGGGSVGYLAHGTATDYMYDIARVPMSFTFEIYGDSTASSKDCFKMFNPTDITTFNRVLNDWSAAFFTLFSLGGVQIEELHPNATGSGFEKWVSIDDYLNGYLMERKSRYGKKMEVLELGMQEIRTYFRLFLLSSVLLMFMFCSRISKSGRQIVSAMSL